MPCLLLVEDEFLIRALMVDAFTEEGFDCIEAATGQAALDILAGTTQLVAVIVDRGLPDMSGDRVIEAAVRDRPGLPVFRCSGSDHPPPELPGLEIHVIAKQFNAAELARRVAGLIGRA